MTDISIRCDKIMINKRKRRCRYYLQIIYRKLNNGEFRVEFKFI